jgi:hypothetical protein
MTKLMQLPLAVVLTFGLGGFGSTPPLKLPHFCGETQADIARSYAVDATTIGRRA